MSDADQEKVEVAAPEPEKKGKLKAPRSGAAVIGSLAGAGVAVPVAAVTFCVAGLAGVPAATALGRSLGAALLMWILVGFAVRLLMGALLADWKKAKYAKARRETDG